MSGKCALHTSPDTQAQSSLVINTDSVSIVPLGDDEGTAMIEIEKRLYCHPAVARATAFRYRGEHGNTGFGAAIVLFDWIEKITAADIKNWITTHLGSASLPVEIVQVDSCLDATLCNDRFKKG